MMACNNSQNQIPPEAFPQLESIGENEFPSIILAKTFMDLRDYSQAEQVLSGSTGACASFMKLYSRYLQLEKMFQSMGFPAFSSSTEQQSLNNNNNMGIQPVSLNEDNRVNQSVFEQGLGGILKEIEGMRQCKDDPFISFLSALIYHKLSVVDSCVSSLLASISKFPWNWSAWKLLLKCSKTEKNKKSIHASLSRFTVPYLFYTAWEAVDLEAENVETAEILDRLQSLFPQHPHLLLIYAIFHYNRREFDISQQMFEQYYEQNPASLDSVDVFSNVLFLRGDCAQLSILAQRCNSIDRYRGETCCVVANFYTLKGEHEKAILYFKRALRLDRSCNGAWTLMGHEYMEIGNTKAALECYRHAVIADERDYRAWFGLGQTYEILGMTVFALYYYQKAVALRPSDSRLWSAVGGAYETLGQIDNALKCYKKATERFMPETKSIAELNAELESSSGSDLQTCFKVWFRIARIYQQRLKHTEALLWFESALAMDSLMNEVTREEWGEALMFVAKNYMHSPNIDNRQLAKQYLMQIVDMDLPEIDQAKELINELLANESIVY